MWTHGTELEAKLRLESAAGGDSPVPPPCRIERDGERDGREEKRLWRLTREGNGGRGRRCGLTGAMNGGGGGRQCGLTGDRNGGGGGGRCAARGALSPLGRPRER